MNQGSSLGLPAQRLDRQRRHVLGPGRVDFDDLVVADHAGVGGDVLLADQGRAVAGAAQGVDPVLAVVVELASRGGRGRSSRCCGSTGR